MIDSQYKLKGKASYSITNDLLGKYVPSFFLKLMPWRITNKGIQNELINGSKPLQYFNMLDYFLFPLKRGIMKTNRAPCSSPWKTKQHATMTKASSACRGQNVNTFNEHSSRQITPAAHRSGLWQETWDVMNGSPPTHASELTLGRGSKGRTTIASGKQSFPSQTSWDTPYSPVMVWVEDFFPCTHRSLCSNKFGTFSLQSTPESCQELAKQVEIFSRALEVPRALQDLVVRKPPQAEKCYTGQIIWII